MSQPEFPPLRVYYTKAPHYRFLFADGVITRSSGSRAMALDFFIGLLDIPDEIYRVNLQTNMMEKQPTELDEEKYSRELQSTVIMTLETAERVRDMIDSKIREIRGGGGGPQQQ